jgi:3-oxoacyl-[acyl-carrier-protein] synthase-3
MDNLHMDGRRLLDFMLATIPTAVEELLVKAGMSKDDVGLFVFHQANGYMLEQLRQIIGIPREKFQVTISHCGNTVSSSIPIALKHASQEERLRRDMRILAFGFGVGYSWAGTIIRSTCALL